MLRKICLICGIGLALTLTACSTVTGKKGYFRDRMQNYSNATSVSPLLFPKGAQPEGIESYYPAPTANQTAGASKPVSTLPPDLLN